ncbi:MAG: HAMP domain-containing histidine kinase, partial [Planctomycetes bacterium]|nr:HAMP domain-containing histidine kinase [Planctomycetota bacterium]
MVSSLSLVIRWASLVLGVAALAYGIGCLFVEGGFWTASLPWSGALPALVSAPVFFAAWWGWRKHRLQYAAILLFLALFSLTILANWPRGAFSPAWYLHPVLALLATTSLGVIAGLSMTLVAVVAMLLATWIAPGASVGTSSLPDAWVHATSLAAVSLASALAGAIVNRLVFMALLTAESQRRKNFESSRALRHREKLLRHALRVETMGDLAGLVCHQLRNTFQVLLGHVTLGALSDDEERKRRLTMIEETLQQSQPLLDQLMRMAHPDEGTTMACDLSEIVRQFHVQACRVLPSGIQATCEAPAQTPLVQINPHGLVHALWNLVINAKQAIDGDGAITIRCGSDRHQVWVEVSDTGPGMPKEIQERIFDPYFTTKPIGQGTGLGLTAVARYVRGSNGIVQVESDSGRGTTFRMRFPRAAGVQS